MDHLYDAYVHLYFNYPEGMKQEVYDALLVFLFNSYRGKKKMPSLAKRYD